MARSRKRRRKTDPRWHQVSRALADTLERRMWDRLQKIEVEGVEYALSPNASRHFPFRILTADRRVNTLAHRSIFNEDTIIVSVAGVELFRFSEATGERVFEARAVTRERQVA
jgi:hypothetical protein